MPNDCRTRSETEIDRAGCGANRHICFVGDSQMRHVYNGVTSLFKGSLEWHGASGAQKTDKSVMQVPLSRSPPTHPTACKLNPPINCHTQSGE